MRNLYLSLLILRDWYRIWMVEAGWRANLVPVDQLRHAELVHVTHSLIV